MDPNNLGAIIQKTISTAHDLAYAQAAKAKHSELLNGKNDPEHAVLKKKLKTLKDQIYTWLRRRNSICSTAEVIPTYPPNIQLQPVPVFAYFRFSYEFKKQKPLWVADRLKDLVANEQQTFGHAFDFHIQLLQNIPANIAAVKLLNFYRRVVLQVVSARAAKLKAKLEIGKTNPKSANLIRRVAPSAAVEDRGVKFARMENGEMMRQEMAAPDESDFTAIVSYFNSESEVLKCWKRSDTLVKREVLFLKELNIASLPCIPLPLSHVTFAQSMEAIHDAQNDTKFMETSICMPYASNIPQLQLQGDLRSYLVQQDQINRGQESDWRSWFTDALADFVSTTDQFKDLSTAHKGRIKKEDIKPERLLQESDDPAVYWSTHFADEDMVKQKKKEVNEAFQARALDSVVATSSSTGDAVGVKTMSVSIKDETGATQSADLCFNVAGVPMVEPASTVDWAQLAAAVTHGLVQATQYANTSTNSGINLDALVSSFDVQALMHIWELLVRNGNLAFYVMDDLNTRLNLTSPKNESVSVSLKKDKLVLNALYI